MTWEPAYLHLHRSGELAARARAALDALQSCAICPRDCRVDRTAGGRGACGVGVEPVIASWNVHMWEEPPITGTRGSGTIFFSGCTGKCLFCQNYPISQLGTGREVSIEELANMFLFLQSKKCHNVNLVTPTHFMPQILKALLHAVSRGFRLPLVYNTSGYEATEALRLLDGIVDIYLPDMKYGSNENAECYSGIKNYTDHNQKAVKEMVRQTGDLVKDKSGIARRGVLIRHLVLPYGIAESSKVLDFLKSGVSLTVTIGIMSQYFPAHEALKDARMKYRITKEEYDAVLEYAVNLGFRNLLCQPL